MTVILKNTTIDVLRKVDTQVEAYGVAADTFDTIARRVPAALVPGSASSRDVPSARDGQSGERATNYAVLQQNEIVLTYKDRVLDNSDGRVWEVLTTTVMNWVPGLNYMRARLRLVEGVVD
jgi:hypothetical protein